MNHHARAAALSARARELRETAEDIDREAGKRVLAGDLCRLRAAVLELRAMLNGGGT